MQDVDLADLPQLAAADLRLLWVNDWYDGPLEAVVEHGGERCLMVLHGKLDAYVEQPMNWVIFRLSAAQWLDEEHWHALFEEHVGHHWCFHAEAPPEPIEPRDPTRFYDPYAKRAPRTLGEALGWVDEMPAR
jgi:hypothetical protein